MQGFGSQHISEFLKRMRSDANRAWFWSAIEGIRKVFPTVDVWVTGGVDKKYIDVRVGRKSKSGSRGNPVMYFWLDSEDGSARLFFHEVIRESFPVHPVLSTSFPTAGDVEAYLSEHKGLFERKANDLRGSSLNPDDFSDVEIDDSINGVLPEFGPSTPLNQILFGPPGTGKTYETIYAALQILDPESAVTYKQVIEDKDCTYQQKLVAREVLKKRFNALSEAQRIRFLTFHQSFSYEDFVEGLRAETDEDSVQIRYEVVDGVFKSLCELAEVKVTQQSDTSINLDGRSVWKMSLGNTQGSDASIYEECIDNGYVLLGYGAKTFW